MAGSHYVPELVADGSCKATTALMEPTFGTAPNFVLNLFCRRVRGRYGFVLQQPHGDNDGAPGPADISVSPARSDLDLCKCKPFTTRFANVAVMPKLPKLGGCVSPVDHCGIVLAGGAPLCWIAIDSASPVVWPWPLRLLRVLSKPRSGFVMLTIVSFFLLLSTTDESAFAVSGDQPWRMY